MSSNDRGPNTWVDFLWGIIIFLALFSWLVGW